MARPKELQYLKPSNVWLLQVFEAQVQTPVCHWEPCERLFLFLLLPLLLQQRWWLPILLPWLLLPLVPLLLRAQPKHVLLVRLTWCLLVLLTPGT